jgi:putative transposase
MEKLEQLAKEHPREGFWKCYHRLRNAGNKMNHKKLHRIYKQMGHALAPQSKETFAGQGKRTAAGAREVHPYMEHGFYERCIDQWSKI